MTNATAAARALMRAADPLPAGLARPGFDTLDADLASVLAATHTDRALRAEQHAYRDADVIDVRPSRWATDRSARWTATWLAAAVVLAIAVAATAVIGITSRADRVAPAERPASSLPASPSPAPTTSLQAQAAASAAAMARRAQCNAMAIDGITAMIAAYHASQRLGHPDSASETAARLALAKALTGGSSSTLYAADIQMWNANKHALLTEQVVTITGSNAATAICLR